MREPIKLEDFKQAMMSFLSRKNLEFIAMREETSDESCTLATASPMVGSIIFKAKSHKVITVASSVDGMLFTFVFDLLGNIMIDIHMTKNDKTLDYNKSFRSLLDIELLEKVNKMYADLGLQYRFFDNNYNFNDPIEFVKTQFKDGDMVYSKEHTLSTNYSKPIFVLYEDIKNNLYSPFLKFSFNLVYMDGIIDFKYNMYIPVNCRKSICINLRNNTAERICGDIKSAIEAFFDQEVCLMLEKELGETVESFKTLDNDVKSRFLDLLSMHII